MDMDFVGKNLVDPPDQTVSYFGFVYDAPAEENKIPARVPSSSCEDIRIADKHPKIVIRIQLIINRPVGVKISVLPRANEYLIGRQSVVTFEHIN